MKKALKKFIPLLFIGAIAVTGCSSQQDDSARTDENKTVRIGYVDSGASFPNEVLAVAIDQGILDEEFTKAGYSVEAIPFAGAGPAINEALVSGDIDIASTGDVPAIIGKSNGIDTVLIGAELNFNDAAIAVPASSDVQTVEDLKGKTVATLQGSYMHKVLLDMLADSNMTIDDIKFTNMTSQDASAALEAGTVDAAVVANTQECVLNESENVRLLKNCDGHDEWKGGHSILARTEFVENNRDAAKAYLKAVIRANSFAEENRDAAIKALSKSGTSEDSFAFLFPEKVSFNVDGSDNIVTVYDGIKEFLANNQLISNDVDISAWLDKTIFEEAQQEVEEGK